MGVVDRTDVGASLTGQAAVVALGLSGRPIKDVHMLKQRYEVSMAQANRGGRKICQRGHKYRGPEPCPVCRAAALVLVS